MTSAEDIGSSEHGIAMRMYKTRGEIVLAACDREILDKNFEEGELHIHVRREFYYDAFVSDTTFLNSLKVATIANLVGKRVVELAIRNGYVDEENVIWISGVPHAQVVLLL